MQSHSGVHGGDALGSRWCGSRSDADDAVAVQWAATLASRTYGEDKWREREVGEALVGASHG